MYIYNILSLYEITLTNFAHIWSRCFGTIFGLLSEVSKLFIALISLKTELFLIIKM